MFRASSVVVFCYRWLVRLVFRSRYFFIVLILGSGVVGLFLVVFFMLIFVVMCCFGDSLTRPKHFFVVAVLFVWLLYVPCLWLSCFCCWFLLSFVIYTGRKKDVPFWTFSLTLCSKWWKQRKTCFRFRNYFSPRPPPSPQPRMERFWNQKSILGWGEGGGRSALTRMLQRLKCDCSSRIFMFLMHQKKTPKKRISFFRAVYFMFLVMCTCGLFYCLLFMFRVLFIWSLVY